MADANADCIVGYDREAGCVTMTWRTYSSEGFRRCNEQVLEALAERRSAKLLGDIEALGRISPADQAWLKEDWIPRAIAAGLRRVALVTPAFGLEHAPVLLTGEQVAGTVQLDYFDDFETGRAWLKRCA